MDLDSRCKYNYNLKRVIRKIDDIGWCTLILVITNVIVYFISQKNDNYVSTGGLNYKYVLQNKEYIRFFSCMFLHSGIEHIGYNMLALFIFGRDVEKEIGSFLMAIMYFVTGIGAGILSVYMNYMLRLDENVFSVGASGAIYGLIAAYIILMTFKRKGLNPNGIAYCVLFILFEVLISWSDGVDVFAHFGGAVVGAIVTFTLIHVDVRALKKTVFTVSGVIITIVLTGISIRGANLGGENSILPETLIDFVKSGYQEEAPDATYERVFTEYFSNGVWDGYVDGDDNNVVTFTGSCYYRESYISVEFKFILDLDNYCFNIDSMSFNGTEQSPGEINKFYDAMFSSYMTNHNISYEY